VNVACVTFGAGVIEEKPEVQSVAPPVVVVSTSLITKLRALYVGVTWYNPQVTEPVTTLRVVPP